MPQDIYKITEFGYQDLLKQIEAKEQELLKINSGRREAWDAGAGDGWDSPEMERIEMVSRGIERELLDLRYKRDHCIIIREKSSDAAQVNIDDVVVVEIEFDEDDIESSKIRLVADFAGFSAEDGIDRVSIDSPLGQAIYKKQVGGTYEYEVNGFKVKVKIVSKENARGDDPKQKQP